ncbi:hypothetical protein [Sutcliffiella horikoshii]|uniref:hypothetical protein n=1 Tax=Sutcliffiella horikoshii TaxID=79883 RepID=UPI00384A7B80
MLLRRRRQKSGNPIVVFLICSVSLLIFFYIIFSLFMNAERDARKVVNDFYEYEKNANYGKSWELLHTEMQVRFDRGAYVQDRAHVFNGHFGADTFTFEVSKSNKISNWKMEKDGDPFDTAYEFEVRQDYRGKYGHFVFVQYVYVVQEGGMGRIVWDYKK